MAATITGVGVGLGLSCSSKLTKRFSSSAGSSRCSVKMSVSVEEQKKNFTLKNSEEAFNVAKVLDFFSLSIFRFDVVLISL